MNDKDLETGEEPETPDTDTTPDDDGGDGNGTSKASDQDTDDTPDSDDESAGSDGGLTPEEQEQRDALLAGTDGGDPEKVQNDLRSELGRERKKREDREKELLTIIDTLSKGGDAKPTGDSDSDDNEPQLHVPSGAFLNDDGSINEEALSEWNLRSTQFLNNEVEGLKAKLEELGVDVSSIHTSAKEREEAQEFERRYGLDAEQYQNYLNIKSTKGDLDAHDYLMLESKSAKAQAAAAAHRDSERGAGTLNISVDGSASTTSGNPADIVQQAAKEIAAIPAGTERIKALAEVPFKYSQEMSAQILHLVAHS